MRVGLIADIHGNHVGLEAALSDLGRRGTDRLVCLGDVAALGPQPREVLATLEDLDCDFVMGNADAFVLDPSDARPEDPDMAKIHDIDVWVAQQLTEGHIDLMRTFKPTVALRIEDVELLGFHGSPASYDEAVHGWSSPEDLDRAIEGRTEVVLAGGHTHFQFVRRHRGATWINPGSVGLAYDPAWPLAEARNAPFAEYAIVDVTDGILAVETYRVPYDRRRVVEAVLASGMPHRDWWADQWR